MKLRIVNAKELLRKKGTIIMALTKAKVKEILSKAGVEAENMDAAVDSILNGHIASIDALREERDNYKSDAERLPAVQKELDDLKTTVEGGDDYKKKYDELKNEYDTYKSDQSAKAEKAAKDTAYRAMLKEIGVSEKRLDSIMRITDLSKIKLDKEGAIEGLDDLKESSKTEWADFITVEDKQGAGTPTPPDKKTDSPESKSRAAEIEAKYHSDLYGDSKSEK